MSTYHPVHAAPLLGMLTLLVGCASSDANMMGFKNEDFRIWCGDHACAWQVEEGEVAPVSTWHRSAKGLGFMSDPTVISQTVEMEGVSCLTLSLLGHLDDDAVLFWEVDCGNDGWDETEPSVIIDEMSWETIYQETGLPPSCTSARVILRKTGPGDAVLVNADFSRNSYCAANETPPSSDEDDTDSACDADGGDCR